MKLTYLGTAAAEGWPAVFCNCEYCRKAKALGGKNIRTRSQAIINDDLLIDFPTDTYHHMFTNKLDISRVKHCFITHSHLDHFQPTDLFFRTDDCYAHGVVEPIIHLYGNASVIKKYEGFVAAVGDDERAPSAEIHEIKAYQTVNTGKYSVTPLPANHAPNETAFVYLISDGSKTLLYLHDTGLLFEEVYDYLEKNNIKADLISYDCTYGALRSGGGHMGLDSVPIVRDRLKEIGVCSESTVSVVNHYSHNGKYLHDEMDAAARELGFIASYDGMAIEF